MEQAGCYFLGQGAIRGKPGLYSPPYRQRLDRAKDRIRMHAAKFVTPKDLRDRALDYQSRKLHLAETLTRPHKSVSGVVRRATVIPLPHVICNLLESGTPALQSINRKFTKNQRTLLLLF